MGRGNLIWGGCGGVGAILWGTHFGDAAIWVQWKGGTIGRGNSM